jgi:hypothetical protein
MRRFNRLYGATPAHALGMLACFTFVGYVASRVIEVSHPGWIAVWLIGAVVAHDLVLFPLYSTLDRLVSGLRHRRVTKPPVVPWQNHLRVPAVLSGVLLLVSFPLVFRLSDHDYAAATGLHTSVYLGRWLLVSAGIFAASGIVYVVRLGLRHAGKSFRVEAIGSGGDR